MRKIILTFCYQPFWEFTCELEFVRERSLWLRWVLVRLVEVFDLLDFLDLFEFLDRVDF